MCINLDLNFTVNTLRNKYVHPTYHRAEMYAGCIAYCPLLSHVEYAARSLLTLEKQMGEID